MSSTSPDQSLDNQSRVAGVIAISSVTCVIAFVIVVFRIYTRTVIAKPLGADDWSVIAAMILAIGTSFTVAYRTHYGMGKHTWTVPESDTTPQLKVFYSSIILYNTALILVKMSFLLLYRRIFAYKLMQTICFWFLIGITTWGVVMLVMDIVPCVPINGYWDLNVTATCIPPEVSWYVQSLINIFVDFGILLLPIPAIRKLHLPFRKKMALSAIFGIGFFACIISVVRLYSLKIAGNSTDPDWDYVDAANWSIAELNVSIMCASLATLRPLVMRVFPFFLEPTVKPQSYVMTGSRSADGTTRESRYAKARGESVETLPRGMGDLENQRDDPQAFVIDIDGPVSKTYRS